jgi:hypothetical protein
MKIDRRNLLFAAAAKGARFSADACDPVQWGVLHPARSPDGQDGNCQNRQVAYKLHHVRLANNRDHAAFARLLARAAPRT